MGILLTTGCPGVGGLSSPSLPEDISSAPPNRSMVPLLSSIQEEKWIVLTSVTKVLQSYDKVNISSKLTYSQGFWTRHQETTQTQLWTWLSTIWIECLWRGKGANPMKDKAAHKKLLSPFICHILVLSLFFNPRSPNVLPQSRYSNMGIKHPIQTSAVPQVLKYRCMLPKSPSLR